jgi:hypothetical protein
LGAGYKTLEETMKTLDCSDFETKSRGLMEKYFKKIKKASFRPIKGLQFDVENVSRFSEDDLKKALGGIKTNVVYIITSQKPWTEKQKAKYDRCKNVDKYAMPRDMTGNSCQKGKKKPCLYVGSSKTDVYKRLKEHIGNYDYKKLSALHLRQWWQDAALKISIYQFEDGIEDSMLQFIEDRVWENQKPLLGKKGPK